jgi:hypothetical protein
MSFQFARDCQLNEFPLLLPTSLDQGLRQQAYTACTNDDDGDGLMRYLHVRHWHSKALLFGGLLLAGCWSNPRATKTQGADTTTVSPSPAAPRTQVRKDKIRQRVANLAAKDEPSPCGLPNDKLYRLILTKNDNEDYPPCPVAASDAEKSALGDPWAQKILLKNVFPTSVADIVTQMGQVPSMTRNSFLVGEGSQIPTTVPGADREANRDLRYVVTWNDQGGSAVVFLSARPGPHSSFLQVIARDARKNWFNFYEYNDDTRVWSWTGNSTYATNADTRGHGCFGCHHNGIVIMKELKAPWNNWHSNQAHIIADVVPQAVADEDLFQRRSEANVLEKVVEGYQSTFHQNRINGLINQSGTQISGVPDLLRSIISQSTVNLVSSGTKSNQGGAVSVPTEFFIRQRLASLAGWPGPIANPQDAYKIPQDAYKQYLTAHKYRLVQERKVQYSMDGSTYFAFLVPAYSTEDDTIASTLSSMKILDDHFEVSLMMVDFQNPIFSAVRERLLAYSNQLPNGTLPPDPNAVSDIPVRFAQLVEQGARNQPACNTAQLDGCTAEQQFLYFWKQTGDAWKTDAVKRIQAYAASVNKRIATPEGINDYMRLAASRQAQMKNWKPIGNLAEFSLLFPRSDLRDPPLRMHIDGTVGAN